MSRLTRDGTAEPAVRIYCPVQVELENLSAKLEPQKQSDLLWKPTILESGTTHTPARVRHAHITRPQGATTKRQPAMIWDLAVSWGGGSGLALAIGLGSG